MSVLELRCDFGKAHEGKPRSEPDRGKPAVRDRRGACGNVVAMGAGLRPIGKPMERPPDPTVAGAPHFYPDCETTARARQVKDLAVPEVCLSTASRRMGILYLLLIIYFIESKVSTWTRFPRRTCLKFMHLLQLLAHQVLGLAAIGLRALLSTLCGDKCFGGMGGTSVLEARLLSS